jgi:hypothetical protein
MKTNIEDDDIRVKIWKLSNHNNKRRSHFGRKNTNYYPLEGQGYVQNRHKTMGVELTVLGEFNLNGVITLPVMFPN